MDAFAPVLVPIAIILVVVVSQAMRLVGAKRKVRWAVGISVGLLFHMSLFWRTYFPSLPDWVPHPPSSELVEVRCMDQAPLFPSRNVYAGVYKYFGTVDDLAEAVEKAVSSSAVLSNLQVDERHVADGFWYARCSVVPMDSPRLPEGGALHIAMFVGRYSDSTHMLEIRLLRNRDL